MSPLATARPPGVAADPNESLRRIVVRTGPVRGRQPADSRCRGLTVIRAGVGSGLGQDGTMREELNAIEARGLVKRFGKTTALAGVDLTARAGSVLGLLGPNGAGKTTVVRILATLIRPEGGSATVCGYDVVRDAHQVRQL